MIAARTGRRRDRSTNSQPLARGQSERRALSDVPEVLPEPRGGAASPLLAQRLDEVRLGIEPGEYAQPAHECMGVDPVQVETPHLAIQPPQRNQCAFGLLLCQRYPSQLRGESG